MRGCFDIHRGFISTYFTRKVGILGTILNLLCYYPKRCTLEETAQCYFIWVPTAVATNCNVMLKEIHSRSESEPDWIPVCWRIKPRTASPLAYIRVPRNIHQMPICSNELFLLSNRNLIRGRQVILLIHMQVENPDKLTQCSPTL